MNILKEDKIKKDAEKDASIKHILPHFKKLQITSENIQKFKNVKLGDIVPKYLHWIQMSAQSLYSSAYIADGYGTSQLIYSICKQLFPEQTEHTIIDCNANIGGNTIPYAYYFDNVIAVEFIKDEFLRLLNNIIRYKFANILAVHSDITEYLSKNPDCVKYSSCLFFDPPWGGRNYKYVESLELYFLAPNGGQINVVDYINKLDTSALIILKCPENTNLKNIKKPIKKLKVIFLRDKTYNLIFIHDNIADIVVPEDINYS
jgi:tRNA/tmRNA/rRNA uracil-C5-methylase (TrmA/RlmC/RlmD family)